MPALFLFTFRFFRLLMSGHQAVALENAALRLQLAAFQRKRKRPVPAGAEPGAADRLGSQRQRTAGHLPVWQKYSCGSAVVLQQAAEPLATTNCCGRSWANNSAFREQ